MGFEIMASMMCADYHCLEREVKEIDAAGIDSFHIDIMDGRYVHNFAMSLNDMRCIRTCTKKPMDVHLMVEHPYNTIDLFLQEMRPGDTVYIHPEAEYHPSTTLQTVINAGMVPGIAINPGTSVETVYEMLRIVDKVLVMTVNPGNAGLMYMPYVENKISKLISLRDEMGFKVYWDGACSRERIETFAPKGVNGFVLGTSILFGKSKSYTEIIRDIRSINDC